MKNIRFVRDNQLDTEDRTDKVDFYISLNDLLDVLKEDQIQSLKDGMNRKDANSISSTAMIAEYIDNLSKMLEKLIK